MKKLFFGLAIGVLCLPIGLRAQVPLSARSGIVIDKSTGQPLPATTITAEGVHTYTDAQGRFQLPAALTQADFHHLGYEPLSVKMPTGAANQFDTVRLASRITLLPAVSIRADSKPHWLPSPGKTTSRYRMSLMPGAKCAVFFRAANAGFVRSIELELAEKAPPEGRLRLSVVGVTPQGRPDTAATLAAPLVLTNQQLKTKTVSLSLEAANIILPAAGVFVVIEGLTSQENEFFLAQQNVATNKQGNLTKTTIYSQVYDGRTRQFTQRITAPGNYPALMGKEVNAGMEVNSWLKTGAQWTSFSELVKLAPASFKAYNFSVQLQVY